MQPIYASMGCEPKMSEPVVCTSCTMVSVSSDGPIPCLLVNISWYVAWFLSLHLPLSLLSLSLSLCCWTPLPLWGRGHGDVISSEWSSVSDHLLCLCSSLTSNQLSTPADTTALQNCSRTLADALTLHTVHTMQTQEGSASLRGEWGEIPNVFHILVSGYHRRWRPRHTSQQERRTSCSCVSEHK